MNISLAIVVFSCVANLFLGILAMLRNPERLASRLFLLICLSISAWAATNYLTEASYLSLAGNDLFNRLAYMCGALVAVTIVLFCYSFEYTKLQKMPIWFWATTALVLPLSVTDFVAGTVKESKGELAFSVGPLLGLYGLFMLSYVTVWAVKLIKIMRHTKGYSRAQAKFILFGASLTVVGAVGTNVIVPLINDSYSAAKFGPLFTIFFVYSTGYAIIRYRLFDMRLAISRLLGYTITISLTATLYSLVIVVVNARLVKLDHLDAGQLAAFVVPTIFVALTFHRVAHRVAKLTQRIFYQDAYDVREVLDQLSDALLADNDIDKMMEESLHVLGLALKPSSAYFAALNTSGVVYKHIQKGDHDVTDVAPFLLRLRVEHQDLIDREELPDSEISKLMAKQDVALLLRLGPQDSPVGVLLLGTKRNGSMYTKQDISLLRIGAKNLGVAIDNARKYEQIIHFADTMHKEVNRATSRLKKANKELKTLDALKDDFISTASHQLRSPAVSVHDALHMLNYPNVSKKDRQELLQLAEGSSERLVTVVRTLLNMARLQAGHFTIDTSEADMVDLIDNELQQVKVLADQKFITLDFKRPAEPMPVRVDVAKLTEAAANYIENAIKYSLEKTTVTITLTQEADVIRFEVADQGMGVPPTERSDLFGRFYRATNARKEQPDGNGIGLYVVRNIAEGHRGEAYYRPGDNGGSVFGFWIARETNSGTKLK